MQACYATGSPDLAVSHHSPLPSTSQYLPVGWPRRPGALPDAGALAATIMTAN